MYVCVSACVCVFQSIRWLWEMQTVYHQINYKVSNIRSPNIFFYFFNVLVCSKHCKLNSLPINEMLCVHWQSIGPVVYCSTWLLFFLFLSLSFMTVLSAYRSTFAPINVCATQSWKCSPFFLICSCVWRIGSFFLKDNPNAFFVCLDTKVLLSNTFSKLSSK